MGAYLSEPNVEKISEDGGADHLSYGASAMQGWRVAMEDSHNCITKLDEDTSLFAVYDGHGGAEVAIYSAQRLPKLLLELSSYKDGALGKALEETFMAFDASLKDKEVIERLKRIAGIEDGIEEDHDTEALLEEAELPLEELVARYCSRPTKGSRASLLKKANKTDLLSPVIQKKQARFPLTAVNGSLQDGDGPVPNKTVPFDEEGDVVPKTKVEGKDEDSNIEGVNRPDGDRKTDSGNGTNCDNGGEGPGSSSGAAQSSSTATVEEQETNQSEAGCSGTSGKCNGDTKHNGTKSTESVSGSSSERKVEENVTPKSDDEDDDSDEDDEDYLSEEEDEEEDDDEDEDEEEEEEEEEGNFDREDFDEEEDGCPNMPTGKEEPGSDSGTTAVVALVKGKELVVANIGDSRCVLSRGGEAYDMSYDHKPEDDIELRRIEKAGGKVTLDGRVNGGLNLSRAFGDHCYKMMPSLPPEEQMISAFPDIQTVTLDDRDNFMVIACDGIWNAMTSQEVVDFVQHRLENSTNSHGKQKLSKICEELFDLCLAPDTSGDGTGCDNMTCVIVQFHHNSNETISAASVGSKRKSTEDKREETDSKKQKL